jgi:hypothetical protein
MRTKNKQLKAMRKEQIQKSVDFWDLDELD